QARPIVEIGRMPADVDEAVDRRRSADHPPARPDDVAPGRAFARLRVEEPRVAAIEDGPVVADRQLHPEAAVGAARLEEQDARAPIGGQTGCERATPPDS